MSALFLLEIDTFLMRHKCCEMQVQLAGKMTLYNQVDLYNSLTQTVWHHVNFFSFFKNFIGFLNFDINMGLP